MITDLANGYKRRFIMLLRWDVPKSKVRGETKPYICPACQVNSRFVLVEHKKQLSVNFIPIASSDFVWQAICPTCSVMFEIPKEVFKAELARSKGSFSDLVGTSEPLPQRILGLDSGPNLSAEQEIQRVCQIALKNCLNDAGWDAHLDAYLRAWARKSGKTYPTLTPEFLYNSVIESIAEKASPSKFLNGRIPTWRKAEKQSDGKGGDQENPFTSE